MRCLILSRYASRGASSRVRFLQYLDYFCANGLEVKVAPLFSDSYVSAMYNGNRRVFEIVSCCWNRLKYVLSARCYDVVMLEKEVLPYIPAVFERLLGRMGVPYLVDYDDALFHLYDTHKKFFVRLFLGKKIDAVMRCAAVVVAGNDYLAERARNAGAARVEVIPSVVDTDCYRPREGPENEIPVVGWIGTPKTSHYLRPLLPVFEALQREMPVRFVAVGAREGDFTGTPVQVWPWSEETEVDSIQRFDIGIMPLEDSPWSRGKCGYKLIQYMACGLPVVASPVGVNRQIVIEGENGVLAETADEWQRALEALLVLGPRGRRAMGSVGRKRVENWYSLRVQAPRFLAALREAERSRGRDGTGAT